MTTPSFWEGFQKWNGCWIKQFLRATFQGRLILGQYLYHHRKSQSKCVCVYCVCVYCMSNDVQCTTSYIYIYHISVLHTMPHPPPQPFFYKGPLLLPTRRQPHTQLPASLASLGGCGFPTDDLPRVSERDVQHIQDESNITQYTVFINGYYSLEGSNPSFLIY